MPNIAVMLRQGIVNVSRRAIKPELILLKKDIVELKHRLAQQRKAIQSLERSNSRLLKDLNARTKKLALVPPDASVKIRLGPKLIRAQRNRLGLSQREFALFLGVSTNTLVLWESGKTAPREKTRAIFASIRKLGRRDVEAKLQALAASK